MSSSHGFMIPRTSLMKYMGRLTIRSAIPVKAFSLSSFSPSRLPPFHPIIAQLMDAPDSRTRKKVALNPAVAVSSTYVLEVILAVADMECKLRSSAGIVSEILIPDVILVFACWTTREWLLLEGVPKSWILMRALACGALVQLLQEFRRGNWTGVLSTLTISTVLWYHFA